MIKNKDLNYALIIFALTMVLLVLFVEFYPQQTLADADINVIENTESENLTLTSN